MKPVWLFRSLFVAVALSAVLACHGEQELHSDCVKSPDVCPPCTTDAECIIVSNECHESAACTHRDRDPPLAVNQIGCSSELEYDRPPPERCGCARNVCRAK
jgi:hypothetical protein